MFNAETFATETAMAATRGIYFNTDETEETFQQLLNSRPEVRNTYLVIAVTLKEAIDEQLLKGDLVAIPFKEHSGEAQSQADGIPYLTEEHGKHPTPVHQKPFTGGIPAGEPGPPTPPLSVTSLTPKQSHGEGAQPATSGVATVAPDAHIGAWESEGGAPVPEEHGDAKATSEAQST